MTPGSAKLVALVCVSSLAACAGGRRIDGSSAATFERSVAMVQNDLPARRREDFDVALAVILMRAAEVDSGDLDADGDVDYFDARILSDTATVLLAEVQRGNLTSAAEKHGREVAVAYFKQLDGLASDDVVELAGDGAESYLAQMKQLRLQAACARQRDALEVRGFGGRAASRCAER
jgi:hypothetical protein